MQKRVEAVSVEPVELGSTRVRRRLRVTNVQLGRLMMTLQPARCVWHAWLGSMQRQAASEHVLAVLLDALLQQLAVKVLLPVISVKQDSTQARALPYVPSAHLAVRMRTRTLPHRALSVQVAHMQAVARRCAMSVSPARSTVMKTLPRPVHPAWRGSTGWNGVRHPSVYASSAMLGVLILTRTAPPTVSTATSAPMHP